MNLNFVGKNFPHKEVRVQNEKITPAININKDVSLSEFRFIIIKKEYKLMVEKRVHQKI